MEDNTKNSSKLLHCSFCGKNQNEVAKLIAGPSVFICDECVDLCNEIISDELEEKSSKSKEKLPKPHEINEILDNYQNKNYSKEDIINIIGSPLVTEDSDNLWIYRMEKEQGNATFKKSIYNKTLKLRFDKNVLRSVEEINLI